MKKALWLIAGIGIGFLVAHQFNQTKSGKEFFAEFDKKAKEFSDSLVDGYREREAELRSAIADAGDKVSKIAK
ncbi:hypothetical protein SCB71_10270 [Herbiconiux sp. KACC 21604]|uniref:YtxH domain-containing protein n=1 Tax=Herbiconiux sp. A18JL235 TaxID=3152363 RepID=A0AB39BLX0_9MICO|nr:hypothetical protein [Herbiconiux sp. SALV-R1]QJU53619.1 hypothetical protein HL652_08225 [Herbiconiux sp. SALV-R1]WPO88603.1 hypothetical protein SCB71_10270 [Herbiconiux sp. KACC 21604]